MTNDRLITSFLTFFFTGQALAIDSEAHDKYVTAWSINLDNDLFTPPTNKDRDYTFGLALNLEGRIANSSWWSLSPLLSSINHAIGFVDKNEKKDHGLHIGLLMFSPDKIKESQPLYSDRPFASLLYLANSQRWFSFDRRTAYQTTFTLGLLGSPLSEKIQETAHDIFNLSEANGWDYQISQGGELTGQYRLSKQSILSYDKHHDVKYTIGASAGYLTELSLGVSGRWGLLNSSWMSFTPEDNHYLSHEKAVVIDDKNRKQHSELYLSWGVKTNFRVYNAFLQGQFKESEVTYHYNELNPVVHHAWLGVTKQFKNTRISYEINYKSSEIKSGTGNKDHTWAGVSFSYKF